MILPKLAEPTLLADQVYATLHEAIVNGELVAGTQLKVRDVAAQVGTSIMPVREAIRRLEEAGLAQRQPHKGAVVSGLSLEELVEVYDVRQVLEQVAARSGALAATPQTCAQMSTELDLLRKALSEGRMVDYINHDEALLEAMYRAGGNAFLVDTIKSLWVQCHAYKVTGVRNSELSRMDPSLWKYQAQLLDAAERHDAELAEEATYASIAAAVDRIRAQIEEQRSSAATAG